MTKFGNYIVTTRSSTSSIFYLNGNDQKIFIKDFVNKDNAIRTASQWAQTRPRLSIYEWD